MPLNTSDESKQILGISRITLGTRKSPLALWQAQRVIEALQRLFPELAYDIVTIVTTGDAKKGAISTLDAVGVFNT